MMFGKKQEAEATGSTPKGTSFLGQVKAKHEELFARLCEGADEFSSVETYTDALESESWKLMELSLKTSYKNGLAAGGQRSRRKAA